MPSGKTHVMIGAFVAVGIIFIIHQLHGKIPYISTELEGVQWIMLVGITYIYSQLPDIDQDISLINKIWNTSVGLSALYLIYTNQYKILAMFAIASIVALEWIKHRGITHEEWFAAIMAAPLWIINPLFAVVAFACYISHIVADGDFMK